MTVLSKVVNHLSPYHSNFLLKKKITNVADVNCQEMVTKFPHHKKFAYDAVVFCEAFLT